MSLRRVDDDGDASAPLSIGAAIDALADRLPVATRLNHVLAIGAKFKLEQLGKPPPPQQQQQQAGLHRRVPPSDQRDVGQSVRKLRIRAQPGV